MLQFDDTVLFDGDCGICSWCAKKGRALDAGRGRWVVEPYQAYSEEELARVGLDYEACSTAVQLVTADGRVFSGAGAVNYFLIHFFPYNVAVASLYLFPVFLPLEVLGYSLVARHRTRISRLLGLDACRVDLE